jgi:hypothetical protein
VPPRKVSGDCVLEKEAKSVNSASHKSVLTQLSAEEENIRDEDQCGNSREAESKRGKNTIA